MLKVEFCRVSVRSVSELSAEKKRLVLALSVNKSGHDTFIES
jgi:hypothetical protein